MTAAGARTAPSEQAQDGPTDGLIEQVLVELPADPSYLALLRSSGAALGARLDFTLDEIEDLRIAVDEAGALLLARADAGAPLRCVFGLGLDELTITVSARGTASQPVDTSSFAWTVLQALAGPVQISSEDGEIRLEMRKTRQERA